MDEKIKTWTLRSISVRLLILFCSRVFILRSYGNSSVVRDFRLPAAELVLRLLLNLAKTWKKCRTVAQQNLNDVILSASRLRVLNFHKNCV